VQFIGHGGVICSVDYTFNRSIGEASFPAPHRIRPAPGQENLEGIMRIEFQRAGGFAAPAMRQNFTVDLNDLSAEEAKEGERLVEQLDIAGLANRQRVKRPQPDVFYYQIVIQDDDNIQTIEASDTDMTPPLRQLIEWLTAHGVRRE
jgi:hypothetical protein